MSQSDNSFDDSFIDCKKFVLEFCLIVELRVLKILNVDLRNKRPDIPWYQKYMEGDAIIHPKSISAEEALMHAALLDLSLEELCLEAYDNVLYDSKFK